MPVYPGSDTVDYGASDPQAYVKGAAGVNALAQNFAQRQAGQQIAAGDAPGGADTLYNAGDIPGGQAIEQNHQAVLDASAARDRQGHADNLKFVADTANALEQVRLHQGNDAVLAAFDKLAPMLASREGATPASITQIRAQLEQHPETFLQAMATHAEHQLTVLSAGQEAVDPITGEVKAHVPLAPTYHTVGADQTLVRDDPNSPGNATGGAPAFAPQPGAPGSQAASPATSPAPPAPPVSAVLQQIRTNPAAFFAQAAGGPVTITSGYRSPEHNATIPGASRTSEHMTNSAWDMTPPPGMSNEQLMQQISSTGVPFDQMIDEGTHVHFGIGPRMRGEVLRSSGSGYQRVAMSAPSASPPAAPPAGASTSGSATVIARGPPKAAPPAQPFTLSPGATRYDASGKPIVTAPAKPATTGPGGGKLPSQDAARLKAMDAMVDNAEVLNNMAQDWIHRAHGVHTGWWYNTIGGHTAQGGGSSGGINVGQAINAAIDPDTRSAIQDLNAISNRATPMLRPTGSGRILGAEYTNFANAFPNTRNDPVGNQRIAQEYQQQLATAHAKVVFFHQWAHDHGGLDGADTAWYEHQAAPNSASAVPSGRRRVWSPEHGVQ